MPWTCKLYLHAVTFPVNSREKIAPEVSDDGRRLMAMNEELRRGRPGAPSAIEVLDLARSLYDRLGRVPGYNEPSRQSVEIPRAVPLPKPEIPQVTTDLRIGSRRSPSSIAQSHYSTDAGTFPPFIMSSPDLASVHHESALQSPVDAVTAFLNARPIHNGASAGQDPDATEGDPGSRTSQTSLLAMILDALRQGVEIYARVVRCRLHSIVLLMLTFLE